MLKTLKIALPVLMIIMFGSNTMAAPFGESSDVEYSQKIWKSLSNAGYVGSNAMMSTPYKGTPPHGMFLDTFEGPLTVDGKTNTVIVKRNYGGKDISKEAVANDPAKFLKAVTVMYKRAGFDADNKDWFWVKFKPNGSLHTNPKGMKLAGKVAKGMKKGCIACHKAAPGGDFVFNHDRYK